MANFDRIRVFKDSIAIINSPESNDPIPSAFGVSNPVVCNYVGNDFGVNNAAVNEDEAVANEVVHVTDNKVSIYENIMNTAVLNTAVVNGAELTEAGNNEVGTNQAALEESVFNMFNGVLAQVKSFVTAPAQTLPSEKGEIDLIPRRSCQKQMAMIQSVAPNGAAFIETLAVKIENKDATELRTGLQTLVLKTPDSQLFCGQRR